MPFNPFSVLTSKIYGALALMAITFACIQTVRIEGFLFIHGYKQDLRAAENEIADWKRANEDAKRRLAERDQQVEAVNKELANATNIISDAAFDSARPAVIRYRDTHRLSEDCARVLDAGTYPMSGNPETPPNPAPPPGMVAITVKDYDFLTDAALQAAVDAEYFQALIRSGQAIPEPDMGAK